MKRTNGYLMEPENKISWSEVKEGGHVFLIIGLFNAVEFENFSWQLLRNFINNNPDLIYRKTRKFISKKKLMKVCNPVSSIGTSAYGSWEKKENGINVYYLYTTKLNTVHITDKNEMAKIITEKLKQIYAQRP